MYGICKDLTGSSSSSPVKYTTGTVYTQIAIGDDHILALDSSGNLYAAGQNNNGQLGNGTVNPASTVYTNLTKIKSGISSIYAKGDMSMAIDTSGNLWIWGNSRYLGIDTSGPQSTPYKLKSGVKSVSICGDLGYYVLDTNGDVWACGLDCVDAQSYVITGSITREEEKLTKIISGTNIKYISSATVGLVMIDNNGICYACPNSKYVSNNGYQTRIYQITKKTGYYVVEFIGINEWQVKIMSVASGQAATAPNGQNYMSNYNDGYIYSWGDKDFSNVTSNLTVNYKKTGITYYVKYNANGGTGSMDNSTHTYGTSQKLNSNKFTRENYKFLGWSKNSSDTTAKYADRQSVSGLTITSNEIVNLYAIWEKVSDVAYKVEHYQQNASLNGYTLEETENLTGTTDTTVTATAKTYTGFTENTSYSGRVQSGNVAGDGSLVLKLYYDRNSYTVTLNTNGGTINSGNVTNYTYGIDKTLPTNVTKTGYTFAGWYSNSSLTGTQVTSITNTETGNKTYYAK